MQRQSFDLADFYGVEWSGSDCRDVLRAQVDKATGRAIVSIGFPFVSDTLTKDEAVAIADQFAPTIAVLLSDMRAELAKMRGPK